MKHLAIAFGIGLISTAAAAEETLVDLNDIESCMRDTIELVLSMQNDEALRTIEISQFAAPPPNITDFEYKAQYNGLTANDDDMRRLTISTIAERLNERARLGYDTVNITISYSDPAHDIDLASIARFTLDNNGAENGSREPFIQDNIRVLDYDNPPEQEYLPQALIEIVSSYNPDGIAYHYDIAPEDMSNAQQSMRASVSAIGVLLTNCIGVDQAPADLDMFEIPQFFEIGL